MPPPCPLCLPADTPTGGPSRLLPPPRGGPTGARHRSETVDLPTLPPRRCGIGREAVAYEVMHLEHAEHATRRSPGANPEARGPRPPPLVAGAGQEA